MEKVKSKGGSIWKVILLVFAFPSSSIAQISDYQIRRLILYKTECKWDAMTAKVESGDGITFFVQCENLSFYPDGVVIDCSDIDDETSCVIETEVKSFDLKMMDQSQAD